VNCDLLARGSLGRVDIIQCSLNRTSTIFSMILTIFPTILSFVNIAYWFTRMQSELLAILGLGLMHRLKKFVANLFPVI
jgi:hypothetical protein